MANGVTANRKSLKWNRRERALRLIFALVQPAFRFSPRLFWGWRRFILRLFGASVGSNVHIYPTVRIAIPWNLTLGDDCAIGDHAILYALGPIKIGDRATVSQYAHLCAGSHDHNKPDMPLTKPPITIGQDSWIAADAFVCPGVVIGDGSVVGARSVVTKNVASGVVVAGNPAKVISNLKEK